MLNCFNPRMQNIDKKAELSLFTVKINVFDLKTGDSIKPLNLLLTYRHALFIF
jgi:hypothetical protein